MKKNILSALVVFTAFFLSLQDLHAGFYSQYSLSYKSSTESIDSAEEEQTGLHNIVLLGASFGKHGRWVIGQSIHHWSLTGKSATGERSTSVLELGPRLMVFLNRELNFYFSAAYHLYAKGSRDVDSESQDISGSALLLSLGYQLKLSRSTYLGLSLQYHSMSISEITINDQKTDSSDKVSNLLPAIDLSLRF